MSTKVVQVHGLNSNVRLNWSLLFMIRIIFLAAAITAQGALAAEDIWPSKIQTGECVSPVIITEKGPKNRELDRLYCVSGNKDKSKQNTCLENSRSKRHISFMTDICDFGEFFIGLNGEEVQLNKLTEGPPGSHQLIGTFSGSGFRIEVSNPKLIRKSYLDSGDKSESNVEHAEYAVEIYIRKGKAKKRLKGKLIYGIL